MKKIRSLLPERVFDQHIVLLGKTRAGKSTVMRGSIAEPLLEQAQPVTIIDPKGDWWGLKLAKDGRGPGFPVVIFGGEHADVPLDPRAGTHVGELLATGNRPALIDMGGWMPGERTRFWVDFASAMFRHVKGRRWLLIDEVHNFAPKGKVLDVDAGKALHWTNRLASEGLGKGIHMAFASQRPQKVHNDTLTSAETLIALKVIHKADRDAVWDWVDGCGDKEIGKQLLTSLAHLERAEGWAWSPEAKFGPERIRFPMFLTYDSFRPQSVADTERLKGWAHVNLDDVRGKLVEFIERAKESDPRELRKRIADLERQLREGGDQRSLNKAESQVQYDTGYRTGREDGASAMSKQWHDRVDRFRGAHVTAMSDLVAPMPLLPPMAPSVTKAPPQARLAESLDQALSQVHAKPAPARSIVQSGTNGSGDLVRGERVILTVLAQYAPAALDKARLGAIAGFASKGGSFRTYVGKLKTIGYIDRDVLRITQAGLDALGSFEPMPTGRALLEHWCARLVKGEREILQAVARQGGEATRDQVGEATGFEPSGGSFRTYVGKLKTLGLLTGSNPLQLHEDLR